MRTGIVRSSAALLLAAIVATTAIAHTAASGDTDPYASRRTAIVTAVEKVNPAVVSITVSHRRVVLEELDPFRSPFFTPFLSPHRKRVVQVAGIGSGFIFDRRGHILTNEHVVRDATEIKVVLPDKRTGHCTLLAADPRADVALLSIDIENPPYAPLGDSDDLMIGEWVIAIGNPFGFIIDDPRPSVGVGVISAVDRTFTTVGGEGRVYRGMIQTDAAINQGNSGGPLVNARGEVIGMNTFIVSKTGGYEGVGFAILINRAKRVADEILQYKRVRETWWGFQPAEVNAAPARRGGSRTDHGLFVYAIHPDSAAARAGLKPGDQITAINGEDVTDAAGFKVAIADIRVGDAVLLDVMREGQKIVIRFTAEEPLP